MTRLAFVCLALFASLLSAASARADTPGPRATAVHVLGIDSDDAEDQADALTGAIRSRVRSAPGWSLQETTHALGMLTAALRCPQKPDAACLQRIGDQLHTDRFIWGVMSKAPGNQVSTEVHLWARGRADSSDKEVYSDNLQDQNDETLRKIATRILDKLTGTVTTGTLTLHAGDGAGVVWINGQKNRALEHGAATISLPPGKYDVEVRQDGFSSAKQDGVVIGAGQDTAVALKLEAAPAPPPVVEPAKSTSSPHHGRVIAGWTLIVVGALAEVGAGVAGLEFISAKSDLDSAREQVPAQVSDVCNSNNSQFTSAPAAATACSKYNQASTDRIIGVVAASAGAVALAAGVVLLLTSPKEASEPPPPQAARAQAPRFQVLPYLTPGRSAGVGTNAGVNFALTF